MKNEMEGRLLGQGDLRMIGYGHLYEQVPFTTNNHFYERYLSGNKPKAGWVNEDDFEPYFLDGEGQDLEKVKND